MSTLSDRWYRFWVARLREMEAEDLADRGDYSLILGGKK